MSKFLKITDFKEITPPGLDGHKYRLSYEVGDKKGDYFTAQDTYSLDVEVSRTLQASWDQTDTQLATTSATSATTHILALASENRISNLETFRLNTYTAPKEPPAGPASGIGAVFPIVALEPAKPVGGEMSFLSDDISEVRDQINALSNKIWGGRVLLLSQERPLFDMYRPAITAEAFQTRIQSLGIVAKDINKDLIVNYLGTGSDDNVGTTVLLEKALTKLSSGERASKVCSVLRNINYLRQGYPAHGDNAKKVLDAHKFFELGYPIQDYSSAWELILGRYFTAMREMCEIFSEAWNSFP